MERTVINGLLTKLGVEAPERFDDDRASKKLTVRLGKGIPTGLDAAETELVEELGFVTGKMPAEGGAKPSAKALVSAGKASKATGKGKGTPTAVKATKGAGRPEAAPTKTKPAKAKSDGPSASSIFKDAFKDKATVVKKADLIKKLLATGCSGGTCNSYFAWAKRATAGKPGPGGNPWGFQIKETKDEETKEVTCRKIKNLA